jgi:prolyl 4-hydroxylase
LEVIGHDGIARNVTMEPGDLVLYESHSILHGRPFPLKGRFMANVFIHFEPLQKIGGVVEYTGDLPPYLLPGSPEEPNWRSRNPDGHEIAPGREFTTGSTDAHFYVKSGNLEKLKETLDKHANLVNVRDTNGWTPLHEAVRAGDTGAVEFLLDRGAEMNLRHGAREEGGSPLWMAKQYQGDNSPIAVLLEMRGAKEYRPTAHIEL